jgi:hypothetical protein
VKIRGALVSARGGRAFSVLALAAAVLAAVVLSLMLGAGDPAEAKKNKKDKNPPLFNVVQCATEPCTGTPSNDLLIGTAINEVISGQEGNDFYVGAGGGNDFYVDSSTTSNDVYAGFPNDQFGTEQIEDSGGAKDVIDLNFASTDFEFFKVDLDNDRVEDDLLVSEITGDDDIRVLNHFDTGKVESIKFSDKTLSSSDLPLS